jgi:HSP20 family protein
VIAISKHLHQTKGEQTMADTLIERKARTEMAPAEAERGATVTPRVDILETDEEMLLFVDLPGVNPDDVDIRFEDGELTLHGRRTATYSGRPWLWEYETGSFHRAFRVNEKIAGDKIHATVKDGVMTIHLPKVEAVKPRKIAVKAV